MKTYGYIPLEDFKDPKKFPAPMISSLLKCIEEDIKEEEKAMQKARKK